MLTSQAAWHRSGCRRRRSGTSQAAPERRPADGRPAADVAAAVPGNLALHAEPPPLVRDAHPVDLAYVSMLKHDAYVAVQAGRRLGFPVVLRPGGCRGDRRPRLAVLGQLRPEDRHALPPGRRLRRRSRRTIAARARARRATIRAGFTTLPNGVPVPESPWQRRPDWRRRPAPVFVGRLAPEKGLDILIDAWPTVRERLSRGPADPDRRRARATRPGGRSRVARPEARAGSGRRAARRRATRSHRAPATPTCSCSPRARRG